MGNGVAVQDCTGNGGAAWGCIGNGAAFWDSGGNGGAAQCCGVREAGHVGGSNTDLLGWDGSDEAIWGRIEGNGPVKGRGRNNALLLT